MKLNLSRRAALAAALALAAGLAQAQTSIRILVGFPPGGGTDAIARILGEKLQAELGQPVVVENKPGAGGQLAGQALKAAAPDGTTVFLSHDHSVSILPLTMKNPGFDPAKDFVPVAGFATFVNAVALSGGTPARDFKAWIDGVKATGGKSTVGIPAPASTPQFAVQFIGTARAEIVARRGPARERAEDRQDEERGDARIARLWLTPRGRGDAIDQPTQPPGESHQRATEVVGIQMIA